MVHGPLQREVRAETQERNHGSKRHGGTLLLGLFLMAALPASRMMYPPGVPPSPVGWALPHQSLKKKTP